MLIFPFAHWLETCQFRSHQQSLQLVPYSISGSNRDDWDVSSRVVSLCISPFLTAHRMHALPIFIVSWWVPLKPEYQPYLYHKHLQAMDSKCIQISAGLSSPLWQALMHQNLLVALCETRGCEHNMTSITINILCKNKKMQFNFSLFLGLFFKRISISALKARQTLRC